MTYKELLKELHELTPDQLEMDVMIGIGGTEDPPPEEVEFWTIADPYLYYGPEEAEDPDHPFLYLFR